MKKLLPLLLVLPLVFFGFGCEENPEEPETVAPSAPRNFTITAGADEESLELSWSPPSEGEVTGYYIYFNDEIIDSVETGLSYTHTPDQLGNYQVAAYNDEYIGEKTPEISTELVTGESQEIWRMDDPSPEHPSGYGWNEDGSGTAYSMSGTANQPYVDLYFDTDNTLNSPDNLGAGWRTTAIALVAETYNNIELAPATGYYNMEDVALNGVYILQIQDGNYIKLQITGWDTVTNKITFKYGFQTIPNFRRMK